MWENSCSGNTKKTNLRQFFAVVHGLHQGALLEKLKEKKLAYVSLLKLLTKENLLVCFH